MALYVTVYMSLMGPKGLKEVNELCYCSPHNLHDRLLETGLFEKPFEKPFLKEFTLKTTVPAKRIQDAMQLTNKAVAEALDGLPAHKMHCSVLAEEAIKSALKDYYDRNGIAYDKKLFPDCENCGHCH